jgi:putative membrane protein
MHGRIVTSPFINEGLPMRKMILLATAFALLAGPALAQSTGEKTGVNSVLGVTPKTTDFVGEVAKSDMFEIQSSKLATSKTQGDVQSFANQMVEDHTKTTDQLRGLALSAKIPLPTAMTSSQQSMLDKLKSLNGDDFAKTYISDQLSAHQTAVSLFERYSKSGANPQLKYWAEQTLPALRHHLEMATDLDKKY